MYVRLRLLDSIDPNSSVKFQCKSVCQSIKDLKQCCLSVFCAPTDTRIRLFFNGKELDESYTLLDYKIRINDLVQVWLSKEDSVQKEAVASVHSIDSGHESAESGEEASEVEEQNDLEEVLQDDYYKIGDHVDALNSEYGAWFEGQIVKIFLSKTSNVHQYDIKFWRSSLPDIQRVTLQEIRPPMNIKKRFIDLKINEKVLVNCNLNDPSDLPGHWFDFLVTNIDSKRKLAIGTLTIGEIILKDHSVPKRGEFYEIRNNLPRSHRSAELNTIISQGVAIKRPTANECHTCGDHPDVECFECACCKCGLKKSPEKQIVCDECNKFYHFWCHPSPITELPSGDWYCFACKNLDSNLIRAKEQKFLNKRKRCANITNRSICSDDEPSWGRGISCVGRSRVCELVPKDHFGPIPDVPVGTWWRFRFQASEAGVHTPLVAGIHGKEKLGAFSIVFCCGYEEDVDLGDEIYYTGSGGRDSSEKKCRVGRKQVKDQEMKKCNKALAMSCYAKFSENGANAKSDWQKGKPVRVLRSGNARGCTKKSSYLPKIGVRYDGIYKVVRYWPEHNADSGLLIWRYLLRRDDENPSPWSRQGKKRVAKLGLKLINPPGYTDCLEPSKSTKRKRCASSRISSKRIKIEPYHLPDPLLNLISKDKANSSIWADILKSLPFGKEIFLKRTREAFTCGCCLEIVFEPIALICGHSLCENCHVNLVKSSLGFCPLCKGDLRKKNLVANKNSVLKQILQTMLSGHKTL